MVIRRRRRPVIDLPIGLPCPLRVTTGLDCPLCGATRATFALVRGDLGAALDLNALYVASLPVLVLYLAVWLVRRRPPRPSRLMSSLVLATALAFALVRNLPFAPFDYLGT